MLAKIEVGGEKSMIEHQFIFCYLDGKRNGCKTFDEIIEQIGSKQDRLGK